MTWWKGGQVSTGKIIHLLIINQQGKQWRSAGKGADVGSTCTSLLVSNQKSYDYLLESDFIRDIEVEEGKGGPLLLWSLLNVGNNVFSSPMVTSSPERGHHRSGHRNRGWQCSNEFETQTTLLMVQFKASQALVAKCPCMVLIFLFLQPKNMHLLFKDAFHTFMLHHYLLQVKAQKCWPGKCSHSAMLECASLQCTS